MEVAVDPGYCIQVPFHREQFDIRQAISQVPPEQWFYNLRSEIDSHLDSKRYLEYDLFSEVQLDEGGDVEIVFSMRLDLLLGALVGEPTVTVNGPIADSNKPVRDELAKFTDDKASNLYALVRRSALPLPSNAAYFEFTQTSIGPIT